MSQHDGSRSSTGKNDRCIAMTAKGRQCQNPSLKDSEYCHVESHGPTDHEDLEIPTSRDLWESFGPVILRITGREGKAEWSMATRAAKAALREMDDVGAAEYRKIFGECQNSSCSNGANGFEAEYCFNHQDSESPDEGASTDPEGVGDLIKTLQGLDKEKQTEVLLEVL